MPYWQLFYHIIWGTKHREPVLNPEIEAFLHNSICNKAIGLGGTVFAVNGWVDHVHLVISIPPKISVSNFVGKVKAVATAKFNKSGHPQAPIYWQSEYGVFSFDRKRLPNYIQYVEQQKEHHSGDRTIAVLEKLEGIGVQMIKDDRGVYEVGYDSWVNEFTDQR